MAKNIHTKKKRVAHNKTFCNDNHEIHPEDHDVIDNIIHEMDRGIPSISNQYFVSNILESSRAFSREKKGPATSRNNDTVPKAKLFKCDKKFPIMERSLKEMKNIKHNRKLTKPRAHLAGLSNSPINNILPTEKSKTNLASKIKKNIVEQSIKKVSKKLKPIAKNSVSVEVSMSKGSNKHKPYLKSDSSVGDSKSKRSNKHKFNMRNDSSVEESPVLESNCDKNDHSSDSDEYERFIEKEKKDLPKKSRKSSNIKRKKPTPPKKVSKSASKNISTESDSDEESEPSQKKRKQIKNNKSAPRYSRISIEKDSESGMDIINDGPHYDSSSESDTPNKIASNSNLCDYQLPEQTSVKGSEFNLLLNRPGDSFVGRDHVLHATPGVSSVIADQPTFLNKTSVINNQPTFLTKSSSIISSAINNHPTMSSTACSTFKKDPDYKPSQVNSVIDLTESGDEHEHDICLPKIIMVSSAIQNDPSCSEESDIELVDVIVNNQPEKVDGTKELNIKTEKVDQTPSCGNEKTQNIPLNKTYEVAYSTNICQEQNETESKAVNQQVNLNNGLQGCLSMPSNSKESIVSNKKVKKEPCDDCEIILDTITTNNSTKHLPVSTTVKVEKDVKSSDTIVGVSDNNAHANTSKINVTKKEQKLHEVACSNFRNLSDMCQKKMTPVEKEITTPAPVEVNTAIQALKDEFNTYQEILQTGQLVESSFKLLERRQAKKLVSLKSQITKLLERTAGSSAGNAIQHAMSMLDSPDISCSQSLKDCAMPSTSSCTQEPNITKQDLKTLASVDFVPLASIPEGDIKPNLVELRHAIKQELESTNNMSLGEKCVVCSKNASAACQQCAKVFFCSNECGKKYWEDGHKDVCAK